MNIVVFQKPEFGSVRIVMRESDPWFVANDVARALGYAVPKDAVAQHCKYAELLKGGESLPLTDSPRGINIIPESDVYRMVMRSKLPSAGVFQDWVCEEVLPSIRKTGSYGSPRNVYPLESAFAVGQKLLMSVGLTGNQLALASDKLYRRLVGTSALEGAELVAPVQNQLVTPTELGAEMNPKRSARVINRLLEAAGMQTLLKNGKWEPSLAGKDIGAVLLDTGKKHSDGTPVRQLKWARTDRLLRILHEQAEAYDERKRCEDKAANDSED